MSEVDAVELSIGTLDCSTGGDYRDMAEAAIAALDAYRAGAIRTAVDDLRSAVIYWERTQQGLELSSDEAWEGAERDVREAEAHLLRLCGIES